jgi:uncharacterized protein Veg
MTISKIKKELLEHVGDIVSIKYNLGRNKYEEYEAIIKELYDYVFLVECDNVVKSFSYIDVITKVIKIDY